MAVGCSFLASQAVVAFLAKWVDFPIFDYTHIFLVAVLFGIGTDYCILLIHRFKEELPNFETVNEAVIHTFRSGDRTVFFSSLTVLVGFSAIGLQHIPVRRRRRSRDCLPYFMPGDDCPDFDVHFGTKLFWPMNKNISHS
ncbi:MMPL family transporter [Weizmannia coagulans]|uniref:MMPL family transporter n=1 Tax=Heyndrickxia coagulans TaxID=1398 RepID=A0AAW7C851_HEYCO|nr:MMPL family transporter [Heyndrickxia coagulans]